MDLALNNLQWLMCHKTKPNQIHCTSNDLRNLLSTIQKKGTPLNVNILILARLSYLSIKITSYLGTDSGSSREKPDEVKMVLYSRVVWNALFSLAVY